MAIDRNIWADKKVFLTGHTGFKGGWLAVWLSRMGAQVHGYSLPADDENALFHVAGVRDCLASHVEGDIRDKEALTEAMTNARPDIVFHLAAQSLVSVGYTDPLGTYSTNVMGTANVLTTAFERESVRAIVSVASDKCYENREWVHPYRETDRLGGADPYSSSKGCAEILTESLYKSLKPNALVATVRAGNVVGGGDWALNRLVPDCIRAFAAGHAVELRRPQSIRPWQFVLEPLSGYVDLAQQLLTSKDQSFDGAWNFGPIAGDEVTTLEIAERLAKKWGDGASIVVTPNASTFKEANLLRLDSTKARVGLGWRPRLSTDACIDWTAEWYIAWHRGENVAKRTEAQIDSYMELQ